MVRYRVKADQAQQNIEYIKNVFLALRKKEPAGLRYASFVMEDGVSFVHLASIETQDGSNPLPTFDEFKAFSQDIRDRCDEPPVVSPLDTIGSYRIFD